jgi:hypothetical protein
MIGSLNSRVFGFENVKCDLLSLRNEYREGTTLQKFPSPGEEESHPALDLGTTLKSQTR